MFHRWAVSPFLLMGIMVPWFLMMDDQDERTVGRQADGRVLVPTNQFLTPAGLQLEFPGRPVDLALMPDGTTLVAKNRNDLVIIDLKQRVLQQTLPAPQEGRSRVGFSAVGIAVRDHQVLMTDTGDHVHLAERQADGQFGWRGKWKIPAPAVKGAAYPTGLAWQGKDLVWVCSSRGNMIHLLNVSTNEIAASVPVGVAPYAVATVPSEELVYVTNWGGDPPAQGDAQGTSSGTPLRIDPRTGVANHGSVSVVRKSATGWEQDKTIATGLHPCAMLVAGGALLVANANSDTVTVIDRRTHTAVATLPCRPEARLPFGSGSCALALTPDRKRLFVANATNNAVLVLDFTDDIARLVERGEPIVTQKAGMIPTGWYPGALCLVPEKQTLAVANVKGVGSLSKPRPTEKGMNTHDHLGSVSLIPLPAATQLAEWTAQVNQNNRLARSLAGLDPPDPAAKPLPVPRRHGEPSVFEHVVYIIKENRTYDQILGGLKEGRGDPNLVLYGEEVTPNHHALAREFTLFDNFYCSGVLSADGHAWINEAYVTDYIEKSFGGFTRSYPDSGDDPLAYAEFGFLWDNALAHKKTFRNYGEYVSHVNDPKDATWFDLYADYVNRTNKVKVTVTANLDSLKPHTHPTYSWWPPEMPDVYRARLFIEELKEFEKKGTFPNLVYITLPCDHAMGMSESYPTPRAMVADNDLAMGQIVEAITHSRFWPKTCIFIVEDDPQDGFDHIDSHRTVAFVVSPFTKRRHVDRTNYNQTGLVKTIELMLGLPPMNQLDLAATPMRNCFQAEPDLTPYTCKPNRIALDERNPKRSELRGEALHWAKKSDELNLQEIDAAEEDTYNRLLWFLAKGPGVPYPVQFTRLGRGQLDGD